MNIMVMTIFMLIMICKELTTQQSIVVFMVRIIIKLRVTTQDLEECNMVNVIR